MLLDVPVRGEDEQLGALPGAQLAQVLGGDGVQPAEPVLAGYRDDTAVGAVDQPDGGVEQPLLAQRIAVVRRPARPRPRVRRLRLVRVSASMASVATAPGTSIMNAPFRQSPQIPKIAMCPMSAWKPRSSASRPASGATTSGSISSTAPHWRQTRCTCWFSPAA